MNMNRGEAEGRLLMSRSPGLTVSDSMTADDSAVLLLSYDSPTVSSDSSDSSMTVPDSAPTVKVSC